MVSHPDRPKNAWHEFVGAGIPVLWFTLIILCSRFLVAESAEAVFNLASSLTLLVFLGVFLRDEFITIFFGGETKNV